jgi:hypothetical protein
MIGACHGEIVNLATAVVGPDPTCGGLGLRIGMETLKRLARPDDMGGIIAFLASEDAK